MEPYKTKDKYFILLPPPNVSGSLHIGHALNTAVADLLVRLARILFRINEKQVSLLPGLDHGGISSQFSALKDISNLDGMSNQEKYTIIENFTSHAKDNILQQLHHLNTMCDFNQLQYTMSPEHIKLVNRSFVTLYNKGLIKEEERIIYWDTHMKTSLSSLEVIHKKIQEKIYFIKYAILGGEKEFITVATTRPETLFGDVALAVGDNNKHLVGLEVIIPFTQRTIAIIYEESVLDDFGTGILKVTPAHDENDFQIGKKHKLPIINILNENFKLNNKVPLEFMNLSMEEARTLILHKLQEENLLEKEELITHSVMFGDKSGKRIETIVKKQWYLDLSSAAGRALKLLDEGEFKIFPCQWESTYRNWLSNLQPWCISREILWGHRIPVWRTEEGRIIVAETEEMAAQQAGHANIKRDAFLLDTWFSSALWPLLYKHINSDFYPSDVLVTAYDIIFFWVARMVMMCLELNNSLPFKKVLLHNLVRDHEGEKMSKTRGNVQNPMSIIEQYGDSDILRLSLLSKITIRGQIRFGEQDLNNSKRLITKIQNVVKFLKMHYSVDDCRQLTELKEKSITNEICIYYLNKLKELNPYAVFENYNIYNYVHKLYNFFWRDYCDWFLEMSKKQTHHEDIKFTLIFIMRRLMGLFSCMMPTLMNKLYEELFEESIKNSYKEINITYDGHQKMDCEKVENMIDIVQQIRSLEKSEISISYMKENTFSITNENLIYESLRIKTLKQMHLKYLLLHGKKIYVENVNLDKLKYILKNKTLEGQELKARIASENPPEEVLVNFNERLKTLEKEIAVMSSYESIML